MDANLQDTVNSVLLKAIDLATVSGEFLQEQVPDVVMQLLWWHGISSLLGWVINIVLVLLFIRGVQIAAKLYKKSSTEDEEVGCIVLGTASTIIALVAGLFLLMNDLVWLQILVAPKLYLVEYAASLVK